MFGMNITYIGMEVFQPETHYIFASGIKQTKFRHKMNDGQSQLTCPSGYKIVNADFNAILFVNKVAVKTKVYEKNGERFSPEFGTPVSKVNRR